MSKLSVFSVLPCMSCGKCCKHEVRHVLKGELGAGKEDPNLIGMFIQENKSTGGCKYLTEMETGVSCSGYGLDNYPQTCHQYPFNYTPFGFVISTTCVHYSKIIDAAQSNPKYMEALREFHDKVESEITQDQKHHLASLTSRYAIRVEIKTRP